MKTLIRHKFKLIAAALVVAGALSFFMLKPEQAVQADQKNPPVAQAVEQTAAAQAPGEKKPAWNVRCTAAEGDPARECEAFQRLVVAKTGQRVAEFAVGFPKDKKDGRGVIILPLGILLTEAIEMQVGEGGQKFKFMPRYCTTEGCFSFIDISQALLDDLKKNAVTEISAKAMNGKDVKIKMTLEGLAGALELAASS